MSKLQILLILTTLLHMFSSHTLCEDTPEYTFPAYLRPGELSGAIEFPIGEEKDSEMRKQHGSLRRYQQEMYGLPLPPSPNNQPPQDCDHGDCWHIRQTRPEWTSEGRENFDRVQGCHDGANCEGNSYNEYFHSPVNPAYE